jgi:hypothetical protein
VDEKAWFDEGIEGQEQLVIIRHQPKFIIDQLDGGTAVDK